MAIEVPAAHILDGETGEYRVTDANDAATSGGDIGAQVPIFPVVWVHFRRSARTLHCHRRHRRRPLSTPAVCV